MVSEVIHPVLNMTHWGSQTFDFLGLRTQLYQI